MSDNPAYRLHQRIMAARAAADVSIDPSVHMVANALQAVENCEVYRLERQIHDEIHGTPDPSTFPRASEIYPAGSYSWPDELESIEIDPRLDNP